MDEESEYSNSSGKDCNLSDEETVETKEETKELLSSEILIGLPGKKEVFVGLVDSGASGSLFSQQLASQCKGKTEKSAKKWTTQGGHYVTINKKRDAEFTLPLFTTHH
eukprot:4293073-Ditylum_brightwellii.AAC.1